MCNAVTNSGGSAVPGNTPNLLSDGSGTTCMSDTLDLKKPCWLRANVAGYVKVNPAGAGSLSTQVYLPQGATTEFMVNRVFATGATPTAVAAADLVLIYP